MRGEDSSNKGKQQATTSQHNKRMRGQHNTNANAMTARGRMTTVMVTAATKMTMTTMFTAAAVGLSTQARDTAPQEEEVEHANSNLRRVTV